MENKESNDENNSTNINEALIEKTKEEILKKSHIPKNKFNRNSLICSLPNLGKSANKNYNRIAAELNRIILSDRKLEEETDVITQRKKNEENDKENEEGLKMNMISEKILNKLREIFQKPPDERTFYDLSTMKKYLNITQLFKYFKNENFLPESIEKMLILCGVEMKYQKYFKDDTIFKIGEQPKYFYLILSGEVSILKPIPYTQKMSGFEYFSHLMMLKRKGEDYIFNKTIQANRRIFNILYDDIPKIHYIFITSILNQILNGFYINFQEMLSLCNLTKPDIGVPLGYQIDQLSFIYKIKDRIKDNLPLFSGEKLNHYLFFQNRLDQYEVNLFKNEIFLTLQSGNFFGDSAFDKNTTRNATVITSQDTELLYLDSNTYSIHLQKEKQVIATREVSFLQQNYFFTSILPKTFEKKYYNFFIYENKEKDAVLCNENEHADYVYFIRKGEVSLYSSRSIMEIHNLLNELTNHNSEISNGKVYSKLKTNATDFSSKLNIKQMNKIFVLNHIDCIGVESVFYGFPYLTTAVVSSPRAVIIKINYIHLKHMFKEECNGLGIIKDAADKKLKIFYDRFFSINNTNLNIADGREYYNQCHELDKFKKQENMKKESEKKSHVEELNTNIDIEGIKGILEKEKERKRRENKLKSCSKKLSDLHLPLVENKFSRNLKKAAMSKLFGKKKATINLSTSLSTKNINNVTYENKLISKLKREIKSFSSEFITLNPNTNNSNEIEHKVNEPQIKKEDFNLLTALPTIVQKEKSYEKSQTKPIVSIRSKKRIDFSKPYRQEETVQKLKKYNMFYNFEKSSQIYNNSVELLTSDGQANTFSRQKILGEYYKAKTKEYKKHKKDIEQRLKNKFGDDW